MNNSQKKTVLMVLGFSVSLVLAYTSNINKQRVKESVIELNTFLGDTLTDSEIKGGTSKLDAHVIASAKDKILNLGMYKAMVEHAPFPILVKKWDANCDCGRMLFWNERFSELFLAPDSINADEYLNTTDEDIWPKDLAKIYTKQDRTVMKTGEMEISAEISLGGTRYQGDFIKWNDGTEYLYLVYLGNKIE